MHARADFDVADGRGGERAIGLRHRTHTHRGVRGERARGGERDERGPRRCVCAYMKGERHRPVSCDELSRKFVFRELERQLSRSQAAQLSGVDDD